MKSRKNNRKYKFRNIMLISGLVLFVFTCVIGFVSYANVPEIEKVLKSEDYNYLSPEAKDYIRKNFEVTGQVLLTEKNKEEKMPYLNPLYVDFLNLTEEEKEDVSYIPSPTVIDFVPTNEVQGAELESYDLRSENLVTPVRDQGHLGLCWTFATASTLETSIMKKTGTTYNAATTQLISERQLDYATSSNGIKDYDNEYVSFYSRNVGSGGNFYISTVALANGISVVDYGWKAYDDTDTAEMELHEVLNYSNSLYEVTGTINVPVFYESGYDTTTEMEAARLQHINYIKRSIEEYGSAVISTYYSDACMHIETGSDMPILDVSATCASANDGHALTVIGWDDNYEYDYCAYSLFGMTYHLNDTTGCSNVVTGKGAWILKNSWGEETDSEPYPYLAYTSDYSQFHFITSMKSAAEKEWDNNYIVGSNQYAIDANHSLSEEKIVGTEKLETIKFMTDAIDGTYNLQIKQADGSLTEVYTIEVANPGLITINITSRDILVSKDSEISISGSSFIDNISVFTSNLSEDKYIDLSNIENKVMNSNEFRLYSDTKNLPAGSNITYNLFNETGNVDSLMTITNNTVAENNINTTITFANNIPEGDYYLELNHDGYIVQANIEVPERYVLEGSGTESDPYLITTESDLNQIRYNLDAHYKLTRNIQLTNEWVPIGTEEEPFRGSIDGNNQVIKNLKINSDGITPAAFIAYYLPKYHYDIQTPTNVSYTEDSYIRNITFENAEITNLGDAAVLIGKLIYDNSGAPNGAMNVSQATLNLEKIFFFDPTVTSTGAYAGSLIANVDVQAVEYEQPVLNINHIFDSSYIKGYYASGLIGYIGDYMISGSGIMLDVNISNFESKAILAPYDDEYADNLMHSPVVGGVYGNASITLESFIISAIFEDVDYFGEFVNSKANYVIGYYDITKSNNLATGRSNGYYVTKFSNGSYPEAYKKATDIKDMTKYEGWIDFENYWEIQTIDGVQRNPTLKSVDKEHTVIEDINLNLYDEVSLLDYIDGVKAFQYIELVEQETGGLVADIKYDMVDPNKETGYYDDISIKALGVGTVTVNIVNHYDGYEKEVTINVTAPEVDTPEVAYYSNYGSNTESIQTTSKNTGFCLVPNDYDRPGYNFMGWSTYPDNREGSTVYEDGHCFESGITSNLKLYAIWEGKEYKLKFDANGGTGEMADRIFKYSGSQSSIGITNNAFTREGYSFKEWNTRADGNGVKFQNMGSMSHDMWLNANLDEITLYAQWKPLTYTITYNANGGTGSLTATEGENGSSVMIKYNIFMRVGYDFYGWNTKADGSGDSYEEGEYIAISSNMTLYAQWKSQFTYSIPSDYSEDKTNYYIDLIDLKTSVNDFKNKFTLGEGVTIEVDIGTKSYVYTGSKTKIYQNGTLIAEYTNIVRGDINGDGNVSAMDYVKVKNHIMNTNKITDPVLIKATDANKDNKISALDYVRIKNIIMGGA